MPDSSASPTQKQFKPLLTEDGSPTLSLPPTWEPMHSLAGALTETLYIYQPTAQKALELASAAQFLSVGLGLGYNEILVAFECLKMKQTQRLTIYSYEKENFLISNFRAWLENSTGELVDTYNAILMCFSQHYKIPAAKALELLKTWLAEKRLILNTAIDETTQLPPCHGIFFDAFSNKTSPELWTPEFLTHFFSQTASECFISTYACTGELKRALKANGFDLEIKKGFAKKREALAASKTSNSSIL